MGSSYSSARNQETEEARHQKLFKKTSTTARPEVKHLVGSCVTYGMKQEQEERPLCVLIFFLFFVCFVIVFCWFFFPSPCRRINV